jgi:hypothetical protein
MRKITKRSAAVIGAAVVAVGATGAAWAAWTITGTGGTSASSASLSPITATATVVGDKLWPGQSRNATVKVTNPNDFPVKVTGVTIKDVAAAGAPGCTKDKAALVLGAVPPNTVIGGKPAAFVTATPTDAGTWSNFVQMGAGAEAACAGATFTVSFDLAGVIA